MKLIILLAGYGTRMRPHTWSRPKPILRVAGNTVVGHILDLMEPLTRDEVIFVVGYKGDQIEEWIRENYGHLKTHFVVQEEALGQAHAVWLCRDFLGDDDVVVAFGDGIVSADYNTFANPRPEVDGVFLVREVEDPRRFGVVVTDQEGYVRQFVEKPQGFEHRQVIVGINWFRNGRQLRQAVDTVMSENRQTLGEYFMVDAYEVMLEQGAKFITQEASEWQDAGKPEATLQTNARLLALGYGTEDALERSYAEGYTVVPPVFIHPTAVIDASIIGPYATIEAGATVRNAVVRNSIIDPDAHVEDCVLDHALVGERAQVKGKGKELFVGDDAVVEL
jgi:glucose-1-phosphate thymidylyltransferase